MNSQDEIDELNDRIIFLENQVQRLEFVRDELQDNVDKLGELKNKIESLILEYR